MTPILELLVSNPDMDKSEKQRILELVIEKKRRLAENKLLHYEPYDYQKAFLNASKTCPQKLLMAANRVGKSDIGAFEVAMHATGCYPDWYEGVRHDKPGTIVCGGSTNIQVRDICQAKLLGEPSDPSAFGTGFIPKRVIKKTSRKAGIPDALSSALIAHASGGSTKIIFLSYESGKEAWMGQSFIHVWLDEEPPMEIYSQALRGVVDCGGHTSLTFTPEKGVTDVVHQFTSDIREGQFLQNATWDDAPHLTPEVREQILQALPKHEREMRSKGIPVLGSGKIYPVTEETISVEPFEIPAHWPRIAGIDFGIDHPTAWVATAHDTATDTVYVYDVLRMSGETPIPIASSIKHHGGNLIPTAWPHDGLVRDKTSGITLRQMYTDEGVFMLADKFENPQGGNGVEAGIVHILDRMKTGRFKVLSHLNDWFEEFRAYHRKDGKIVKKRDDLMDATRYAVMSLRFAMKIDEKHKTYVPYEDYQYYTDEVIGY